MTATMPGRTAVRHAVIYARVSADDQRQRRSVGQQEQECRDVAADADWTVDQVFTDNDRSASRYARKVREAHAELLAYLATADVQVLILWEPSRGDRELESWAGLLNLCRRRGIRIHIAMHRRTYDLDQARDWRTLAEDGVDSAYESEKTRERIMRHVRDNAMQGRPHGKLRYGFRRVYDDRGAFVAQVHHEEQAAIIREAARRVSAGEALYGIAQDLNDRGVPAPRGATWQPTQIKRLVTDPAYIGQRVHQGRVVGPAVWDAILDEQTHAECVARLTDPARRTQHDTAIRHLLSGVMTCAECGSRMRVQKNRGYLAYLCVDKFCTSVETTKVEGFITDMVLARLSRPDAHELFAARRDDGTADARTEAAELRTRLDGFYAAAATGGLSPAGLAAIEARLLPQIEDADRRSVVVPVPSLLRDTAGPDAAARWDRMTMVQRRELLRLVVVPKVAKGRKGQRGPIDPMRLGASRWVGDDRTWAEIWAADNNG
ncbi:recombinase family protein [Actinoplanes sp. Pm04-4]|uniref:Recombinase family protein n=1 Tax=Paractinoplanes pyxinae TaxID=2997416 RepID=A0ABT4B5F0_9ACTN|nr:recombinase family protein [Actinoplanes pyxinae]MCY1141706.1 recombinase family protein [Actinoplanes pyxinae]